MNLTTRYVALVFCIIAFIFLLATFHPLQQYSSNPFSQPRRANAALVMLARNSDIIGVLQSVHEIEDRFNQQFQYPYVFLNEEPFTADFKRRVSALSSAPIEFGLIPPEHWYQPDWIDEEKANKTRERMAASGILYGGSQSYRNMCRYNSGFFFKHPLLLKYRWYWRIEPSVHFTCQVSYDPFLFMQDNDKVYGFTISMQEYRVTIHSLWRFVKSFVADHPEHITANNSLLYLSDASMLNFNLCHFWSNFEIADMSLWRSEAYQAFFNHLDATGGFYYERWGDAPVHSIGAALFARKDQLHHFSDFGYSHIPMVQCPKDIDVYLQGECTCDQNRDWDSDDHSFCMKRWKQIQ